jgi:hypothetical protein
MADSQFLAPLSRRFDHRTSRLGRWAASPPRTGDQHWLSAVDTSHKAIAISGFKIVYPLEV